MNSLELTDTKNILQQRLNELVNKAEVEKRKLNEGEELEFNAMIKQIENIDNELATFLLQGRKISLTKGVLYV